MREGMVVDRQWLAVQRASALKALGGGGSGGRRVEVEARKTQKQFTDWERIKVKSR